ETIQQLAREILLQRAKELVRRQHSMLDQKFAERDLPRIRLAEKLRELVRRKLVLRDEETAERLGCQVRTAVDRHPFFENDLLLELLALELQHAAPLLVRVRIQHDRIRHLSQ